MFIIFPAKLAHTIFVAQQVISPFRLSSKQLEFKNFGMSRQSLLFNLLVRWWDTVNHNMKAKTKSNFETGLQVVSLDQFSFCIFLVKRNRRATICKQCGLQNNNMFNNKPINQSDPFIIVSKFPCGS